VSEQSERLAKLRTALGEFRAGRLAIPLGGYPDPDAMAAAWALSEIAAREGVTAHILHCYPVSHVENQRMVRELGIPLEMVEDLGLAPGYSGYALVDAASLDWRFEPLRASPCVSVWDHHGGELGVDARVTDIRDSVGSTSTMATEYLDAAGILDPERSELSCRGTASSKAGTPLSRLATALLLGIATDTQDYLLAQEADFSASARLATIANRATLQRIHHRAYSVAAMDALRRALESVERRRTGGVAWIGDLHPSRRDTVPQAADLLLAREDLNTVVVYARIGNTIDGSVRTSRAGLDVPALIVRALGVEGFSGGREGLGGFRLPLPDASPDAVHRLRARIAQGFLDAFAGPKQPRKKARGQ
jgi:nanoRNase/pAp phosphatase (c-di-AMP/oligoRNAs hydrolase)